MIFPERPTVIGSAEWHRNLSQYMMTLQAVISQEGWSIQAVFPSTDAPSFLYTVGLYEQGFPELVIVDVPLEAGQQALGEIASHAFRTGDMPGAWSTRSGAELRALPRRSCDSKDLRLTACHQFYRRHVDVTQVLWPSETGAYPIDPEWEHGATQPVCDPYYRK